MYFCLKNTGQNKKNRSVKKPHKCYLLIYSKPFTSKSRARLEKNPWWSWFLIYYFSQNYKAHVQNFKATLFFPAAKSLLCPLTLFCHWRTAFISHKRSWDLCSCKWYSTGPFHFLWYIFLITGNHLRLEPLSKWPLIKGSENSISDPQLN